MLNIIGIIIVTIQLISLALEIYFYCTDRMELGLLMNIIVIVLMGVYQAMRLII